MGHRDAQGRSDSDENETARFSRLREILSAAIPNAPTLARQLAGVEIASLHSLADLARVPVVRKSELKSLQESGAAIRRSHGDQDRASEAPAGLARTDLRTRRPWRGLVGRCALPSGGGLPRRRHRPQLLLLSPDAGRPYHGKRRPCARLRRHSSGNRQYRPADRSDPISQAQRLLRHARLLENPDRQGA